MKNYEAEKLRKIIQAKEKAMALQVEETDALRKELTKLKSSLLYTHQDMSEAFYAGKNHYFFEPWMKHDFKQTK